MRKAIIRIVILLKWIILGLFAFYMLKYVAPIAFIIGLFMLFYRKKIGEGFDNLAADLKNLSISLDQLGNVTIFNWLWFLFKNRTGYKFGNPDETISYVLKVNYEDGTLRLFGRFLYNVINTIDPGHFTNLHD